MEKLPWWGPMALVLIVLAGIACQAKREPPSYAEQVDAEAEARSIMEAEAADLIPTIGDAQQLPAGCEIWAVGPSGREWRVPAIRIQLRSPDGPTDVSFDEGGAVQVRCFGIQTLRFGAAGGVDDVIRLELAAPAK